MHALSQWAIRRSLPLLATVLLIAIGMASSVWWGPAVLGSNRWQLPNDLWGTLLAAQRLSHLNIGGIYSSPTGLVSFPGAALILVPVVALIDVLGLGLGTPSVANPHPGSWLAAGPYEIAISAVVLFAADSIAERMGASRPKRFVLAAAQAVALWNVSIRWGHPEDAVAVALLLYAAIALKDSRSERSAWLLGLAVVVQPLVLLGLPIFVVGVGYRRVAGFLVRAAAPSFALVGAALVANWRATIQAIGNQPNWPSIDHPTPWIAFAPHMSHGAVAAGPGRAVAILLACACAIFAERTWRGIGSPPLEELLWWLALSLALRCVFESVMVAYYIWPALALALLCVTTTWSRLAIAAVVSCALTFASQLSWHGRWGWWAMTVVGIAVVLIATRSKKHSPVGTTIDLARQPLAEAPA